MSDSSDITLPRWLRVFFLAVAEAPWTNLKVFNALIATNVALIFLAIASLFHVALDEAMVEAVLIFLASWLGISMVGQIGKRVTYKPSPPYGPDIEDAQAGATAEHPVPKAGVVPTDPQVRAGVNAIAVKTKPSAFGGRSND